MEQLLHYVWLVPILPACAALLIGVFGRDFLGAKVSAGLAVAAMLANIVIAFGCFLAIHGMDPHTIPYTANLYEWIVVGHLKINMAFAVDQLTCVMLLFISFVGSLVFIYSTGYMHGDKDYTRFFALLSLFASAMFILVLGDSFVTMFIGWEGVGLCSYLLIGFYMDKDWAVDAGKKAFIVNRVGDFGFLLGMFILFWACQSLKFSEVFDRAPLAFEAGGVLITAATLLLFLGATGKSAQIPLFIWLPDAMAGPTPVSALIHAATMVTAGVYMVARCSPIFELAPVTLAVIAVIGALTAFVAATIGLTQRDIKKVLAYSTVSQLGYMFLGCGVGAYAAGIFHVFTHSFFKGCLFLCAGSVIHGMAGEQDMLKMGGLAKKMKITFWTYLISCVAIAGIPPFSGFFSKDEILWKTWEAGGMFKVLWGVGLVAALMTSIYMFRSLWLTFLDKTRADDHAYSHAHESPRSMTIPLIILAIGAMVVGFLNVPAALSGTPHFEHFLAPALADGDHAAKSLKTIAHGSADVHAGAGAHHGLERIFMVVSFGIGLLGALIAGVVYWNGSTKRAEKIAWATGPAYKLSFYRWWWDDLYNKIVVGGTVAFAYFTLLFDIYIVDGLVNGIGRSVRSSCARLRQAQSGQVQVYALSILIGVNLILAIVLFLSR